MRPVTVRPWAASKAWIPAREIEDLVTARIAAFLDNAGQVIDELAGSLATRDQERLIAAAGIQAERWPRMAASEQRGFILHVVAGVAVSEREILIELRGTALRHTLVGEALGVAPGDAAPQAEVCP